MGVISFFSLSKKNKWEKTLKMDLQTTGQRNSQGLAKPPPSSPPPFSTGAEQALHHGHSAELRAPCCYHGTQTPGTFRTAVALSPICRATERKQQLHLWTSHAKAALVWITCLVSTLCTNPLYVFSYCSTLARRKAERQYYLIDTSNTCACMHLHTLLSLHDFTLQHWHRASSQPANTATDTPENNTWGSIIWVSHHIRFFHKRMLEATVLLSICSTHSHLPQVSNSPDLPFQFQAYQ